ncbi:hypothetical protein [Micromonospora sp. C41]|uniref:hypothetical protein n=1 Tax=Micromonospora sp. C41 TaxID=2824878 RepID=UPI001B3934DC|nr:hypothetical protein [Micromonospora sp. C41]MBQ1061308.1 hypothetical protein [Micromonospora sp. C41]
MKATDTERAYYAYLRQGEWWVPKKPRPPILIADMDPEWRHNAARFLMRRAPMLAFLYLGGEIAAMTAPVWGDVVGEDNGRPVLGRRTFSELDLMSDAALDAFDEHSDAAMRDPEGWLRTTALYRALVAGLPTEGPDAEQLAERARHWSTCPARTGSGDCRCEQIRESCVGQPPASDEKEPHKQ